MPGRLCLLLLAAALAWAQPPIARNPVVEVKGTIAKIQLTRGQGMPHVEVKTGKSTIRLFLGPMRFLMQENFNPKAGESIEARGYKLNDEDVIAIRVDLPESKKILKLRDDQGYPVWMGRPDLMMR